jgi:hypothetical protein
LNYTGRMRPEPYSLFMLMHIVQRTRNNECGPVPSYEGNYTSWQHCSVKHKVTMMKVKEESVGQWSSSYCLITVL